MHGAHIFDCCCTWLICAKQHFLVARCGRTTDTDWRHALHSHTAQSRYCCIWLCANAICQREWKFTQYRVQCCRITRFVRRWTGILCPKIPNRNFYNKIMASIHEFLGMIFTWCPLALLLSITTQNGSTNNDNIQKNAPPAWHVYWQMKIFQSVPLYSRAKQRTIVNCVCGMPLGSGSTNTLLQFAVVYGPSSVQYHYYWIFRPKFKTVLFALHIM